MLSWLLLLDIHVAMVTPPGHTCCCGYPILHMLVAMVTSPGHTCCYGCLILDTLVAMVTPPGHTCCRVSRAAPAHGCCCSRLHDTPVAVLPVAVHAFTPVLLRLPPPAHACRHGDPTLGCHGAPSRTRLPLLTRLPCVAVVTPSCTRVLSRFPVLRTHPHTRVAMATPALSRLLPWQPLRCPGYPIPPRLCTAAHACCHGYPPLTHTHTRTHTHTPVAMVTPYGRGRTPAARPVATATRCYGSPLLWLPVATVTGCHGYRLPRLPRLCAPSRPGYPHPLRCHGNRHPLSPRQPGTASDPE